MDHYCTLQDGLSWSDFAKKGFTVVQGFLSEQERDILLEIYDSLLDDSITHPGGNGGHKMGYRSTWLAGKRIADYLPGVAERIRNLTADAIQAGVNISSPYFEEMFFTTNSSDWSKSMRFGWHQDIENYFFFQDLTNYLAFYMFLRKPDPRQAGLTLVPWDALEKASPELIRLVKAERSVHAFIDHPGGRMVALNANSDAYHLMEYHLDEISCSPELHPGDLLLFAGDTIHRTQEHSSWRISLNINVHQEVLSSSVSIAEQLRGGFVKYDFMRKNADKYVGHHTGRIGFQSGLSTASPPMQALDAFLHAYIRAGFEYRKALDPVRKWLGSFL